jgi:hypothetical protein
METASQLTRHGQSRRGENSGRTGKRLVSTALALVFLAARLEATVVPPALNLAALGGSAAVAGVNISDAIFYPYGATVSAGGNILFGANTPQGSLGITGR